MKKFMSLLLTFAMVCSLVVSVPVWADTTEESATLPVITNISLHIGADPSQRNLSWFSTDETIGVVAWAKAEELVDGAIPADADSVIASRDVEGYSHKASYYHNKAVISGLEPNTVYYYQLKNGADASEMYSFTTGDTGSSFSFAFIADAQIGSGTGGVTNGDLGWARTVNQIANSDEFAGIDFLMSAGDQVNAAEGMSIDFATGNEMQYDVYLNQPAIPSLTQAVVLGNHDDKMQGAHVQHFYQPNMDTNYGDTYYWKDETSLNSADYYFVYNSALFVVLNTNNFTSPVSGQPWSEEGRAANKAAADEHGAFIEKVMEETKDNKDILWKIVMYHQSPYGGSYHGNTTTNESGYYNRGEQYAYIDMREYLMPYIYENGFDLVLSGHDHCYTRTHIIKPEYDEETGSYTPYSEMTAVGRTEADGSNYYNADITKVTDPDGVLHVTAATSSGSQVNNVDYPHDYAVKTAVAKSRHASKFDITPNSLSFVVYNLGNNVEDSVSVIDTFTIERTADVILQDVTVDETATIPVGQTKDLNAKLSPAEPSGVTLEWKSDDETVATVDENGNVTAVSPGTANITVTATDNNDATKVYTAACAVTVIEAVAVESISILPASYEMQIGDIKTLTATVSPEAATTKELVWTSNDETIAAVSSNGSVTAVREGTVTITATATDGSGVTGTCAITVNIIPATKLTINKEALTLNVLDTDALSVAVEPENASYRTVTWTSSDAAVVSVDENGAIKALKAGTAVITATTGEGKSVSCTVTSKGGVSFLQNYEDETYTKFSSSSDGAWSRVQDEDGNWVLWCDGSKITSISQSSTALDSGLYAATLAPSGFTISYDFYRDVDDAGYSGFQTRTYNANGTYSGVTLKSSDFEKGVWYNVKMVYGTSFSEWKIYAKKATEPEYVKYDSHYCGNVTNNTYYNRFFLSPFYYSSSAKDTLEVAQKTNIKLDNVKVAIPVAVTGLTLSEESGSLDIGETVQLTHTLAPSDATDTNVCYTSSDPSIATVDQNGLVKAKSVGDAVITATSADGLFTDTYAVNVYSTLKAESITVPESLEITVGETKQITATVLPEGAPSSVAWSSSDETIATVDEDGNITAIKHGTVTITAKAVDGSEVTGSCAVTVNYIPSTRTLNKTALVMDVLTSDKLTLTFEPANASYQEITWSSSDTSVATVAADGTVKATGNGTATIYATTLEGSVECTVTVKGGVTYLNDFEDTTNTKFTDGSLWTKVQEEDGNWALDFNGANLTSSNKHLDSAASGAGVVPIPGATGGFVVDFDVKRVSAEGHQAMLLRIGTDETVNHWWKVSINSFDLNEWYDVKLHIAEGMSATLYWKKASDSEWQSTTDWWSNTTPFRYASKLTDNVSKNSLIIYPYVATNSDDASLASAQKTHFRLDNIKVSSPVAATGYGIAEDNINLAVGEAAAITNAFTPSYATDTHITYTSSDVNVATVDKNGRITAVGEGNAVITAIAADGGFTDTVTVAVGAVVPEITAVRDGSKFTVTTNVAVNGEKVYLAAYNASDVMIGATLADYVADGTELTLTADGASYYKAFIWGAEAAPVISEKAFN